MAPRASHQRRRVDRASPLPNGHQADEDTWKGGIKGKGVPAFEIAMGFRLRTLSFEPSIDAAPQFCLGRTTPSDRRSSGREERSF